MTRVIRPNLWTSSGPSSRWAHGGLPAGRDANAEVVFSLQEPFEPQAEGGEVAQPCCCCDHPATHHFAVSYRGQVLRGAICEEHGNAVARERLGLHDGRRNLGNTKIGRALTDPNTTPYFRRIAEPEHQEIAPEPRRSRFDLSSENRFSPRRRRSMSRSRYSGSRGSNGKRDSVGGDAIDIELVMVPDTAHQSSATHAASEVHIPDTSLIIDPEMGNGGSLHYTPEGDPSRVKIADAIEVLDKYAVPLETGEKKADQLLKQHGESILRTALRAAIKERRALT